MKEATAFGLSLYGDEEIIKGVSVMNALDHGVHQPFSVSDVFDCTDHCSEGEKKMSSTLQVLSCL